MVTTTMIKTQQASAQATGWNPPEDAQKRFKEISNGLERAVSDEIGTKDTAKVDAAFRDYCTQLFDIFDFDFKCSAGFHNPHN